MYTVWLIIKIVHSLATSGTLDHSSQTRLKDRITRYRPRTSINIYFVMETKYSRQKQDDREGTDDGEVVTLLNSER